MASKWRYGNAWEKFPIAPGEIWGIPDNGSRVAVHNIFDPLPSFMAAADLIFVDPPWNLGNLNAFYTKAGRADYQASFEVFADALFERLGEIELRTCYIEIGRQWVEDFAARLGRLYPVVQRWPVTYYRKFPTWIIRGGSTPAWLDLTGIDEAQCIDVIARCEEYACMGDLCIGQGLVGLAAYGAGRPFVGTELNCRRLAVLLQKLARRGAQVARYGSA